MSSLLVGAVLTFAAVDGSQLQLTVSLTQSAPMSLTWGDLTQTSSSAHHTFRGLPTPKKAPLTYTLSIRDEPVLTKTVRPLDGPLSIALYGDSRGGSGPHRRLIDQMVDAELHVLVHTGDVIQWAGDHAGWTQHLSSTLPLSSSVPLVLALGNHDIWAYWQVPEADRRNPLAQAMRHIPPPVDPISKSVGVFPSCFHVRIEDMLIVSIDSNQPMSIGSPVARFLEAVLEANRDAKHKFVAMHHGPRSSGHHGSHADGDDLVSIAERYGVTAFLAGHDHVYERIVQGELTVVVAGGGGAPLYQREHWVSGSQTFSSTYNWVRLDISEDHADLSAYSVEGVLLDSAMLPPTTAVPITWWPPWGLALAAGAFLLAFLMAVGRVVFGRVR